MPAKLGETRDSWPWLPLALFALGAGALAVAAGHYRLEWLRLVALICLGSGFLIGGRLAFVRSKTRRARALVVAGFTLVSLAVACGAAVASFADMLTGPREVTSVVKSPDLCHELVVESYSVLIDPAYDVWLRETDGLFARRVRLWTSREGPAPRESPSWDRTRSKSSIRRARSEDRPSIRSRSMSPRSIVWARGAAGERASPERHGALQTRSNQSERMNCTRLC